MSTWRWTAGRLSSGGAGAGGARSGGAEGGKAPGRTNWGRCVSGGSGGAGDGRLGRWQGEGHRWHEALGDQEAVGQHGQGEVPVQAVVAAALVVIQPALPLGILIELLDGPAQVGQRHQGWQGRVHRPGR
jgi:hypothetical protein